MISLRDIKRRIQSIENIHKITLAMKMISTVKLKKTQQMLIKSRQYCKNLKNIIDSITLEKNKQDHFIFQRHDISDTINIIVITSDKGLCGSFNNGLIRETKQFIEKIKTKYSKIYITTVGRKGYLSLKKVQNTDHNYSYSMSDCTDIKHSNKISEALYKLYSTHGINSLWIVNNDFRSVVKQVITFNEVLPMQRTASVKKSKNTEYDYEPSQRKLLDKVIPQYFAAYVYQKCLESATSEHAARMQAMENASKNAKETFDVLKVQYNRIRQANITSELIEIISGAESLKK